MTPETKPMLRMRATQLQDSPEEEKDKTEDDYGWEYYDEEEDYDEE